MATPITSYSAHCAPYVQEQYKQATRLRGVVDLLMAQCDDLEAALWEVFQALDPSTTDGVSLDWIAALVCVTRLPGETDAELRGRVFASGDLSRIPTMEALRKFIQFLTGVDGVGMYPVWPGGLYFVLFGEAYPDVDAMLVNMTSGCELARGTFLCDPDDPTMLLVTEDGSPVVVDALAFVDETLIDSDGDDLEDDEENFFGILDYPY